MRSHFLLILKNEQNFFTQIESFKLLPKYFGFKLLSFYFFITIKTI